MRYVHPSRLETFRNLYATVLADMAERHPTMFAWPASEVSQVVEKMIRAVVADTYNLDGKAFQATIRRLTGKTTRKTLEAYLTLTD